MLDLTDKIERIPWDQYFMIMAKIAALRSTCNSRPGGAVVVKDNRILSTGYVGSVKNAPQCTDFGSEYCYRRTLNVPDSDKYNYCRSVHAEANAINYASKYGISVQGGIMYCTLQPCIVCVKNLASSGIIGVTYELPYSSNDVKRDQLWKSKLLEYNILHNQLKIDNKWFKISLDCLKYATSKRRLKSTD